MGQSYQEVLRSGLFPNSPSIPSDDLPTTQENLWHIFIFVFGEYLCYGAKIRQIRETAKQLFTIFYNYFCCDVNTAAVLSNSSVISFKWGLQFSTIIATYIPWPSTLVSEARIVKRRPLSSSLNHRIKSLLRAFSRLSELSHVYKRTSIFFAKNSLIIAMIVSFIWGSCGAC